MDSLPTTEDAPVLNYTPLELPPNTGVIPQLKTHLKKPIVFIPLILLLLIGGSGFLFIQSKKTQKVIANKPTPTTTPTLTPTPTPTKKLSPTPTTIVPTKAVTPTVTPGEKVILQLPTNTPSPQPTQQPTRTPNPPAMNITYPTAGQEVTLSSGQQFCVVDTPGGGDQSGLQRKQNTNGSWTSYASMSTLCYDPTEGSNTLQLRYKNQYGEESPEYTITFTVHKS